MIILLFSSNDQEEFLTLTSNPFDVETNEKKKFAEFQEINTSKSNFEGLKQGFMEHGTI